MTLLLAPALVLVNCLAATCIQRIVLRYQTHSHLTVLVNLMEYDLPRCRRPAT